MPVIWHSAFVFGSFIIAQNGMAQSMRGAVGRASSRPVATTPKPAFNSMSKTTTPFECEQYRTHPHPGMKGFCEGMEASTLQGEARRAGRPGPSTEVVVLPALGSAAAKAQGMACINGQAMRRLSNGWEQVASAAGGWQRCREG